MIQQYELFSMKDAIFNQLRSYLTKELRFEYLGDDSFFFKSYKTNKDNPAKVTLIKVTENYSEEYYIGYLILLNEEKNEVTIKFPGYGNQLCTTVINNVSNNINDLVYSFIQLVSRLTLDSVGSIDFLESNNDCTQKAYFKISYSSEYVDVSEVCYEGLGKIFRFFRNFIERYFILRKKLLKSDIKRFEIANFRRFIEIVSDLSHLKISNKTFIDEFLNDVPYFNRTIENLKRTVSLRDLVSYCQNKKDFLTVISDCRFEGSFNIGNYWIKTFSKDQLDRVILSTEYASYYFSGGRNIPIDSYLKSTICDVVLLI